MTGLSRRRLLGGLAVAGGVIVTAPLRVMAAAGAVPRPARRGAVPSQVGASEAGPGLARWESLIGQSIQVTGADGRSRTLVLRAARPLRPDARLEGDGYALLFAGPRHDLLPVGMSVLRHPSIRPFRAGLLPVNQPVRRQAYQLIVDRRRPVPTSPR